MIIAMTKDYSTLYHATSRWDISNDFNRFFEMQHHRNYGTCSFHTCDLMLTLFFQYTVAKKKILLVDSLLF